MSLVQTRYEVEYPETDGRPMGETDVHRAWMIRIYDLLKWRYRHERVYVGSDLLLYYTEGMPQDYLVTDDFVVKDCDPGPRRTFKTWVEKRVPNVVFEVTSKATRREDEVFKPKLYGRMGVKELFLYDPTADYLDPPLQGFRLGKGRQARITPDAVGRLVCQELGILLQLDQGELQLLDTERGDLLLTEAEAERAAREAAEARAAAAEKELTALREQLEARPRGRSPE